MIDSTSGAGSSSSKEQRTRAIETDEIAEIENRTSAKPFLRWAGGKRWLLPTLDALWKNLTPIKYIEPFLGGGAVALHFAFPASRLSDINRDLVCAYQAVQASPGEVKAALNRYKVTKAEYLAIRSSNPTSTLGRATRLLYLNRLSFSGLFRVNQRGQFNVPYGGETRTLHLLTETDSLARASSALEGATIRCEDFGKAIGTARAGDLVYCDPIYTTKHNDNGFRRYNEAVFSWEDQERLARLARRAAERGAIVFVSNALTPDVEKLYRGFKVLRLSRRTSLSADSASRGLTKEALYFLLPK